MPVKTVAEPTSQSFLAILEQILQGQAMWQGSNVSLGLAVCRSRQVGAKACLVNIEGGSPT